MISDGKVVYCCVDWSRLSLIGDVAKESLQDIWNGAALNTCEFFTCQENLLTTRHAGTV